MKGKSKIHSQAFQIHNGPTMENYNFEKSIFDWIIDQRHSKIFVFMSENIAKFLSLSSNFKEQSEKNIIHWVYPFFKMTDFELLHGTWQQERDRNLVIISYQYVRSLRKT